MRMPDFIINDQTKRNAHRFFLRNSGGKFDRFRANPVMLHNHDENRLIGRWDNLRADGDLLMATPVFDEKDPEAVKIRDKVDGGFLKGASPGIIVLNAELVIMDGVEEVVVTEWELMEASLTPVPSNAGSVCLYSPEGARLEADEIRLSIQAIQKLKTKTQESMDLKTIAVLLALNPEATEAQVTEAITALKTQNQTHAQDLAAKEQEILRLTGIIKQGNDAKVKALIDGAVAAKKIDESLRATYTKLAETDYEGCEKALSAMQGVSPIIQTLGAPSGSVPEAEQSWTFSDYVKNNRAEQLKATNIERFKELYKAQYGREYVN